MLGGHWFCCSLVKIERWLPSVLRHLSSGRSPCTCLCCCCQLPGPVNPFIAASAPGLPWLVIVWHLRCSSFSYTAVCRCLQDQMAAAQDEFGDQLTQVGSDVAKVRAFIRQAQQDWLQLPPCPAVA